MRYVITVLLALNVAFVAFGQSATIGPVFDSVDLYASKPGTLDRGGGLLPGGRFNLEGTPLAEMISFAYGIEIERVSGGPSWIDKDQFDVDARVAPGASPEAVRAMLRSLLANRFQLAIHNGQKEFSIYALIPGKRPNLKASRDGESHCDVRIVEAGKVMTCQHTSMVEFAKRLRETAADYLERPVTDLTGLHGDYDFSLRWSSRVPPVKAETASSGDGVSLFEAIDRQLGLKLEVRMQAFPVIAVDNAVRPDLSDRKSTSSSPVLPVFETAELRRSATDVKQAGSVGHGRLVMMGYPLKSLIAMSFGGETAVSFGQDPNLIAGPPWIEKERYDVIAKAPRDSTFDEMRLMLRQLLIERCRLATHTEERPAPVYGLVLGKSGQKLQEASASGRSLCKLSSDVNRKTYTCTSTTMAQFAERLNGVAAAHLDHPAVDLTGLSGAYDFAITWTAALSSPPPADTASVGGPPSAAIPQAADPTAGEITVFEAIERQLGLRMEARKHPMPILVIDRVEHLPADR